MVTTTSEGEADVKGSRQVVISINMLVAQYAKQRVVKGNTSISLDVENLTWAKEHINLSALVNTMLTKLRQVDVHAQTRTAEAAGH